LSQGVQQVVNNLSKSGYLLGNRPAENLDLLVNLCENNQTSYLDEILNETKFTTIGNLVEHQDKVDQESLLHKLCGNFTNSELEPETLAQLLDCQIDAINQPNASGQTPLDVLLNLKPKGNKNADQIYKCVQELVSHPTFDKQSLKNGALRTPFEKILKQQLHAQFFDRPFSVREPVDLTTDLLRTFGKTKLVHSENPSELDSMPDILFDHNYTDSDGNTALHRLFKTTDNDVYNIKNPDLLEHLMTDLYPEANNTFNKDGKSPLMMLIESSTFDNVKLVLNKLPELNVDLNQYNNPAPTQQALNTHENSLKSGNRLTKMIKNTSNRFKDNLSFFKMQVMSSSKKNIIASIMKTNFTKAQKHELVNLYLKQVSELA
jgi:ankyrin repeat protein